MAILKLTNVFWRKPLTFKAKRYEDTH